MFNNVSYTEYHFMQVAKNMQVMMMYSFIGHIIVMYIHGVQLIGDSILISCSKFRRMAYMNQYAVLRFAVTHTFHGKVGYPCTYDHLKDLKTIPNG